MFKTSTEKQLQIFVDKATNLGLGPEDRANALNFLAHNEGGECFDTVAVQMHEYDIQIDYDFLSQAYKLMDIMHMDRQAYAFLEELLTKGDYKG
jgi:hypothetical protein